MILGLKFEADCAVAQQLEVRSQNDHKSYWSEESKSGDADDSLGHGNGCKSFRDYEGEETGDAKFDVVADYEDSTNALKRRSSNLGRRNDYEQQSPDCNNDTVKPQLEKLGWKSVGRYCPICLHGFDFDFFIRIPGHLITDLIS